MKKYRVMIFPCGAENALEINDALKYHVDVEVWGGSSVTDHGLFAYQNYLGDIPFVNDPNFVQQFNNIITTHNINFVIPTHDTIALFFAKYKQSINATILTSKEETAFICRNKKRTYEIFKDEEFCPLIFDDVNSTKDYPVFVKPNIGEGAKGTTIVHDNDALQKILALNDDLIVVEYLPGEEFTIDCFTNNKGELLFAGPRTRNRIKIGIAFHSETIELTDEIFSIARTINKKISFTGLWFFQVKKDSNGTFKLLEVSTRCAGTMALYRQRGVNFPLLSLLDAAGVEVSVLDNKNKVLLDRCLKARYKQEISYKNVYLDFDDTVIVNGKVNLQMIVFLYQCNISNRKVYLLTRHEKEIIQTLREFCICENLFEAIIPITWQHKKSDFITATDCIFIDNSFSERLEVHNIKKIPVFDVDAVESLITND